MTAIQMEVLVGLKTDEVLCRVHTPQSEVREVGWCEVIGGQLFKLIALDDYSYDIKKNTLQKIVCEYQWDCSQVQSQAQLQA